MAMDTTGMKWYTEKSIQDIAKAIRYLDGDDTPMLVTDMPARILNLGNNSALEHKLNLEIDRSARADEEQKEAILALRAKDTTLEGRINDNQTTIAQNAADVEELQGQSTELYQKVGTMEGKVDEVYDGLTTLTQDTIRTYQGLDARIKAIEEAFNGEY